MLKNDHENAAENKADIEENQGGDSEIHELELEVHDDRNETSSSADSPDNCINKYKELEAKLADLNDQYIRKAADFENFRKRMNREKLELTDFANQSLISDLLPVMDDFERAIKSAESCSSLKSCSDFTGFYNGITMIEKALSSMLESKWGLKRFDSEGEPFDPNRHEAMLMEKSPDVEEAMVKEEFSKGYTLKDRVIRYAKVTVLMPEGESG